MMIMMVQANRALENEDDKMEHTFRSEVPTTFSWAIASKSVLYHHVTFYIYRDSEAVSAERALRVMLARNRKCGRKALHGTARAILKLSFAQVKCAKITHRLH